MKIRIHSTSDEGKTIELLEPLSFELNGREYTIPAGYFTNGFSAPRFLWSFISPCIDPRTLRSACIHDWLYENHVCTRKEADEFFYKGLIESGLPKITASLTYWGIRAFGSSHYTKEDKK